MNLSRKVVLRDHRASKEGGGLLPLYGVPSGPEDDDLIMRDSKRFEALESLEAVVEAHTLAVMVRVGDRF